MAVTVLQEKNNGLGLLGGLAQLGGMMIPGASWLTPLGQGLGGLNAMTNGESKDGGAGAFSQILEGLNGAWKDLSAGNIGKVKGKKDDEQPVNPGWWMYGPNAGLGNWGAW